MNEEEVMAFKALCLCDPDARPKKLQLYDDRPRFWTYDERGPNCIADVPYVFVDCIVILVLEELLSKRAPGWRYIAPAIPEHPHIYQFNPGSEVFTGASTVHKSRLMAIIGANQFTIECQKQEKES